MINVHFVEKFTEGDGDLQIEAMRKYMNFVSITDAEVIYCGSIAVMKQALVAAFESQKPLVVYCWDYYKWAHEGTRTGANAWDWKGYAEMMQSAALVIAPSTAQQNRLRELLGIESVMIPTGIKKWTDKYPDLVPSDGGFILDPLRYYPEESAEWCVRAAGELGIPVIHSEHQYTDEEFGKIVASCTFLTCGVQEASTGTLTVSEALWFGKKALLSDSPHMGGRTYLRNFATYFDHTSYEDCKEKIRQMWETRPKVHRYVARAYFNEHFGFDLMAKRVHDAIGAVL